MEKNNKKTSKKEIERKVRIVRQAIIELRENPESMKKVKEVLVC